MHGGAVEARSEGAGRGTEIRLRLPLTEMAGAEPAAAQVEAELLPPQERRRILVADDNNDAAGALALRLELAGHDVRTAHDGLEALAVARDFEPEVILLDLGMPAMDGYETARHLRQLAWGKQARLIALTGWGQQQDRIRTAEAGFDVHLVKPVSELDLFRAIAAAEASTARTPAN
jgi:CheY-like chemotaxis protein